MKKRGLIRNFIWIMIALGTGIVLLMVVFYSLTERVTRDNMTQMAESGSGAVLENVEKELLRIEDAAYYLAHFDAITAMAGSDESDYAGFYDLGATAKEASDSIISNAGAAEYVVVFRPDGLFYRLKGGMPNTALKQAHRMIRQNPGDIVIVMYNDHTYIGTFKHIAAVSAPAGLDTGESAGAAGAEYESSEGYVALFMDNVYLEGLLGAYNELDYLGIALLSDDRLIAANKEIDFAEVEKIKGETEFYREKQVGFTGFRLFVWCEDVVPPMLTVYFTATFSVMIVILILLILFSSLYLIRHMLRPMNQVIMAASVAGELATPDEEGKAHPGTLGLPRDMEKVQTDALVIPHTGERYFDDLVDHINDMVGHIEEREKALRVSQARLKEVELEKERTLINLLKKQISAHFTVNTLNAVRALVNKGEKKEAAKICEELSTLLRYANAGDEYISLMDEFYVLQQYVGIMQIRYPGLIEADFNEDDSFADVYIPRMLLQPVLENAILHGLRGKPGKVEVFAEVLANEVCVTVKDNGRGMTEEELTMLNENMESAQEPEISDLSHVALPNVRKRIKMVCGEAYDVKVNSVYGEGCEVRITFPRRIGPD
ncbi:MAG: histidine kinase [Lachnospiraceae bacterium]|nr:histidine kinase [Lachnospiraceae bacterium]